MVCLVSFLAFSSLFSARWREITPEEFSQKEPKIDPDFGAEVIFSEATLEQSLGESGTSGSFQYYNRIKVFNEQGVEQMTKMELVYSKGREIRRVEGRTVKPDGTVIKLENESIFDQEVVRKGRTNVRAVTFAFPNLEAGDIVELQYSQRAGKNAWVVEMDFLSEFPSQRVYRKLQPFTEYGIGSKILTFQLPGVELKQDRRGAYEFELTNLPAKTDEPYSMPELNAGPYVVLYYYNTGFEPKIKQYWQDRSKELYKEGRSDLKPSKDIANFVQEYTAKASTSVGKLKLLYEWCQSEPTNLSYSYGVYTDTEREALAENYSPQHTFSRKYGTPEDINGLFGAMAKSLGLEVQLASTNDIRDMFFNEGMKAFFALDDPCVAIKFDDEWHFYNPGESPFLAFDSLPWWACASSALVGNSKEKTLIPVPMPPASYSIEERKGVFTIDENGTLSGTVTLDMFGFKDLDMKESLASRHTEEDEQGFIIKELKQNLANVEASNFTFKNRSSRNTITISYDLEIPEYADVTGKRIFLQPAVFQKNADPIFTEEKRVGDLLFPYPWTEKDSISIQIPENFALEEGSAPQPIDLGGIGTYEAKLGMTKSNKVKYNRTFAFNLRIAEKKFYDPIMKVFTIVNQLDQHTLTFKRIETEQEDS